MRTLYARSALCVHRRVPCGNFVTSILLLGFVGIPVLVSKMAEFVGERLRIRTDEGTYEGIVHSIDPVKQRLTLSKGKNKTV